MASPAALVDAHVHVHSCFQIERLFECANANFSKARRRLVLRSKTPNILALTESSGVSVFGRLRDRRKAGRDARWTLHRTSERDSLVARRDGVPELTLVAGRQIETQDRFEVLAIGNCGELRDGLPLEETLKQVHAGGAIAVVPWGFGKWWGRRGEKLAAMLPSMDPEWFFLGDNGGRPRLASCPPLFEQALELGIRILPGSDPLPLPREARRVGSYGFVLREEIDRGNVAAGLCRVLRAGRTGVEAYGERLPLRSFLQNQLGLRIRSLATRRGS